MVSGWVEMPGPSAIASALEMIARMAKSLGGKVELFEDGFAVEGPQVLRRGEVDPRGDHRIAMAAAVAARPKAP